MEIIDNIYIYLKACFQIIKVVRYAQNYWRPLAHAKQKIVAW